MQVVQRSRARRSRDRLRARAFYRGVRCAWGPPGLGCSQPPEWPVNGNEHTEEAPALDCKKAGDVKAEQSDVEKTLGRDSLKEVTLKAISKGLMSELPVIVNVHTAAALVVDAVEIDRTVLPGKGQKTKQAAQTTEHTENASAVCWQKDSCSAKEHLVQPPGDDCVKHCKPKARGRLGAPMGNAGTLPQRLETGRNPAPSMHLQPELPALARETVVKAPAMNSVKELKDEAPRPLDELQYGDSFCAVTEGLRLAEVSRALHRLAIRLWSPSIHTWSEVIDSIEDKFDCFEDLP